MPVQKFRTLDEASRALAIGDGDSRALETRIAALWSFSSRLSMPLGFRGVRKYASIDDANADRDRMTIARPAGRAP